MTLIASCPDPKPAGDWEYLRSSRSAGAASTAAAHPVQAALKGHLLSACACPGGGVVYYNVGCNAFCALAVHARRDACCVNALQACYWAVHAIKDA